jgi:phage terminase small subunit
VPATFYDVVIWPANWKNLNQSRDTHLRLLEGNRGKRPIPRDEPKPQGDLKDAPEWLTAAQKEGWEFAIRSAPAGLLKMIDRSALTVWVVAESYHREAAQQLAKHGMLIRQPHTGEPDQSPYLAILNHSA